MSQRTWILLSAVVVSLGWGLRGYIGGGPFGAMIPGALLALLLCQLLGFRARGSAAVAACAALGIGFGGEMTYGQTLGLLRHSDTFWWGLTGTTLKGGVWGLLGGAMLGLGFTAHRLSRLQLLLALVVLLAGVTLGIHFVNVPKLIYFSDPVNRPRDESWAGFLLGAVAVLAYLRVVAPGLFAIPGWFSASGVIGGAIGFGGGSLLIAAQFHLPQSWRWLPYWKFMEFAFGWMLGAALGYAAYQLRQRLAELEPTPAESAIERSRGTLFLKSLGAGALVLLGVFWAWPWLAERLAELLADTAENDLRNTAVRVLAGFTGLGCLLMLLGFRWPVVAWQVAITVTIAAAANDLQRDLLSHGGIDAAIGYRVAIVAVTAGLSAMLVAWWQAASAPRLRSLFFGTCLGLMVFAYLMGAISIRYWVLEQEKARAAGVVTSIPWGDLSSLLIVHAIFTGLLVASLVGFARIDRRLPSD